MASGWQLWRTQGQVAAEDWEGVAIIHYAPAENLEHIDVALIDGPRHEIDLAAYVLTDWPVMQALTRAADRGVKVRVYLDGTQLTERGLLNSIAVRMAAAVPAVVEAPVAFGPQSHLEAFIVALL